MDLLGIADLPDNEVDSIAAKFIRDHTDKQQFSEVDEQTRPRVWSSLFSCLEDDKRSSVHKVILNCCRILSRDRSFVGDYLTAESIETLLRLAGLRSGWESTREIEAETLKVMSNLVFQSAHVRDLCANSNFLELLIHRIEALEYSDNNAEIVCFNYRLLFITTALSPEQKEMALVKYDTLSVLNNQLKPFCDGNSFNAEVMENILKIMFSLSSGNEDSKLFTEMIPNFRKIFDLDGSDQYKKTNIIAKVVEVITNMENAPEATKLMFCQDDNFDNVERLLTLLEDKIDDVHNSQFNLKERISPVLLVLWNISLVHPPIRKYLKGVVLPPLSASDIKRKPEEGSKLRNKLVALLTNSDMDVSTMIAEFLFVLCKRNVARLVKHTGYGNAAGLLARRGLLRGGKAEGEFSSDSDSDSDEYKQEVHKVNPIIGCIEEPKRNPLADMTEEQKEYEANRLVNLMDQLSRDGCIQPCTIGEDGKPTPVQHVLQLLENGKDGINKNDESD